MEDLMLVLGMIGVTVVTSGVIVPLLTTGRRNESPAEREARLRDELAAIS
jgi:hypothetical protein